MGKIFLNVWPRYVQEIPFGFYELPEVGIKTLANTVLSARQLEERSKALLKIASFELFNV